MLPLIIFHSIIISLLIVLGIIFSCRKGAFLIAGYNTSPKEVKNRIDEKLLCRFLGKVMFLLAGCWLIIALGGTFYITSLHVIDIALFVIVIVGAAVYVNAGNRFVKESNLQ